MVELKKTLAPEDWEKFSKGIDLSKDSFDELTNKFNLGLIDA